MFTVNLSNSAPVKQPQKILVIKLGALGDFIYALGSMKAIRAHHPDAHITLMTTSPYEELGKACGYFNSILLDPRPKWYQFSKIKAWKTLLNKAEFDRVYDLQNNDRTFLYFKLFSPKPEWVGAVKGASHRNASPERSKYHAIAGHQQTLGIGGISNVTLDDLSWMQPKTPITLPPHSVLLVTGSSPSRPQKRWPAEHYNTLCYLLNRKGYHPVLIGGPSEIELNKTIAADQNVTDLTGQTTIYDLPHLAKQAVGAVGNDTGPIHILSVTNMPLLALFDPSQSNIIKHGPQGEKSKAIEHTPLSDLKPPIVLKKLMEIIESEHGRL